jgi:hypothetical protein
MLDRRDGAIKSNPHHHLGIGEVQRPSAKFPEATIRHVTQGLEMAQKRLLQRPADVAWSKIVPAGMMQGIERLAEGIDLRLGIGIIADADRLCAVRPTRRIIVRSAIYSASDRISSGSLADAYSSSSCAFISVMAGYCIFTNS